MKSDQNNLMIPGAIVLAGLLIAGAIILSNAKVSEKSAAPGVIQGEAIEIAPVTEEDHLLGDPKAKVIIVEYSDLECPYCKQYHATLHRIIDYYGPNGGVAWVYRNFAIHSAAVPEAEASECAAEQGGDTVFFEYIDRVFQLSKSDNNPPPTMLVDVARELELDLKVSINVSRVANIKLKWKTNTLKLSKAGAQGTPYTVLAAGDDKYPLSDAYGNPVGAASFEDLKGVVDDLLK